MDLATSLYANFFENLGVLEMSPCTRFALTLSADSVKLSHHYEPAKPPTTSLLALRSSPAGISLMVQHPTPPPAALPHPLYGNSVGHRLPAYL